MNIREAGELKKLIDSFVESPCETAILKEAEKLKEEPAKEPVAITKDEENQLFRSMVPEGFDWKDAKPVRSPLTQDRVFLQFGKERRWIPDLETLQRIGYGLADVQDIDDEQMRELKEGFGLLSVKIWQKK